MKNKTASEYIEILTNVKKITENLIIELQEYGNGNTVVNEKQASVIKQKIRDSKIDEILKKD
jgi:hypothetical protein